MGLEEAVKGNHVLYQHLMNVTGPGSRVAKAMTEYISERAMNERQQIQNGTEVTQPLSWMALKNALQFSKAVENGAFDKSPQIFAQLPRVGPAISKKLYAHVRDFRGLFDVSAQQIQQWTGKRPEGQHDKQSFYEQVRHTKHGQ